MGIHHLERGIVMDSLYSEYASWCSRGNRMCESREVFEKKQNTQAEEPLNRWFKALRVLEDDPHSQYASYLKWCAQQKVIHATLAPFEQKWKDARNRSIRGFFSTLSLTELKEMVYDQYVTWCRNSGCAVVSKARLMESRSEELKGRTRPTPPPLNDFNATASAKGRTVRMKETALDRRLREEAIDKAFLRMKENFWGR